MALRGRNRKPGAQARATDTAKQPNQLADCCKPTVLIMSRPGAKLGDVH